MPVDGPSESPDIEIYQLPDFNGLPAKGHETDHDVPGDQSETHALRIELGRTKMTPATVSRLGSGDVVSLDNPAEAAHDIYVDDKLVARGEVLVREGKIYVRVKELVHH